MTTTTTTTALPVYFCDGCRRTIRPHSMRQFIAGAVYCVRCSGIIEQSVRT